MTIVDSTLMICRASHVIKNSKCPSLWIIIVRVLKNSVYVRMSWNDKSFNSVSISIFVLGYFEFLITWLAPHIINDSTIIATNNLVYDINPFFHPGPVSKQTRSATLHFAEAEWTHKVQEILTEFAKGTALFLSLCIVILLWIRLLKWSSLGEMLG